MKIITVKQTTFFFSSLTLGILLGAICTMTLIGHKVDELYYKNKLLELQLESTTVELEQVKASLSKSKVLVVTKIVSEIKLPPERFTSQEADKIKLALNKEIMKHYKPLVGKTLKSLDPAMLPKIIDGRIMEIEQKQYKVYVKSMVLSETIFLEVEVEQVVSNVNKL